MIQVQQLSKNFDGIPALTGLDLHVKTGSIYGLVGTNGAGKTTLIKHLTGFLQPDSGTILLDGQPVYENRGVKSRIGYIPDDLHFYSSYSMREASGFYSLLYPGFDRLRFQEMTEKFGLDSKRKLSRFSKGMQKQAAFALIMSCRPDFLILDEPIDGLDPIVRKLVWKYVVEDVAEREMTVLVSSHNLREMEGICDSIGLLSHGSMKIERDLDELKSDIHKVQVAFRSDEASIDTNASASTNANPNVNTRYEALNVLHSERRGNVELLIIRDKKERVEELISAQNPILFDLLPLSLEEIFIYELGGEDHELEDLLF